MGGATGVCEGLRGTLMGSATPVSSFLTYRHGRCNQGSEGDIVPLLGPGGIGGYNENDLPGD